MKLRKRIAAAFTALALMFTLTDPAALGGLIGSSGVASAFTVKSLLVNTTSTGIPVPEVGISLSSIKSNFSSNITAGTLSNVNVSWYEGSPSYGSNGRVILPANSVTEFGYNRHYYAVAEYVLAAGNTADAGGVDIAYYVNDPINPTSSDITAKSWIGDTGSIFAVFDFSTYQATKKAKATGARFVPSGDPKYGFSADYTTVFFTIPSHSKTDVIEGLLPGTVTIDTEDKEGSGLSFANVPVTWKSGSSFTYEGTGYDQTNVTGMTFTIVGTATVPTNRLNDIDTTSAGAKTKFTLKATITVDPADKVQKPSFSSENPDGSTFDKTTYIKLDLPKEDNVTYYYIVASSEDELNSLPFIYDNDHTYYSSRGIMITGVVNKRVQSWIKVIGKHNEKQDSDVLTGSFTVAMRSSTGSNIPEIHIIVDQPVGGQALDISAELDPSAPDYETETFEISDFGAVQWKGGSGSSALAEYNTEYTMLVEVIPNSPNYVFLRTPDVYVNGVRCSGSTNDTGTFTIVYTFEKTGKLTDYRAVSPGKVANVSSGTTVTQMDSSYLPKTVTVVGTKDNRISETCSVTWDLTTAITDKGTPYNPKIGTAQTVTFTGKVRVPDYMEEDSAKMTVTAQIYVEEASKVPAPWSYPPDTVEGQGTTVFNSPQDISLESAVNSATIYYNIEAYENISDISKLADPTETGGTKYIEPITLSGVPGQSLYYCIKAIATAPGMKQSDVSTFVYKVVIEKKKTQTPKPTPEPGNYASSLTITLNTETPGAKIYYTLDPNATKSSGFIEYTGPFDLKVAANSTKTFALRTYAKAPNDNWKDSDISEDLIYKITVPKEKAAVPVPSVLDTASETAITLTLSCATAKADIYYSIDTPITSTYNGILYKSGTKITLKRVDNQVVTYKLYTYAKSNDPRIDDSLVKTYTYTVGKDYGVKSIEIVKRPAKYSYYMGEKLNVVGGLIKVTYIDETKAPETVYMTESMIQDFDSWVLGQQTLTVYYQGCTAAFNIVVRRRSSSSSDSDNKPSDSGKDDGKKDDTTTDPGTSDTDKDNTTDGTVSAPTMVGSLVKGWTQLQKKIAAAAKNSRIVINLNGNTSVPADIINTAMKKKITLEFVVNDMLSWVVDTGALKKTVASLSVGLKTSDVYIPTVLIDSSGDSEIVRVHTYGKNKIGAVLYVKTGKKVNNRFANLFRYNEDSHQLDFVDTSKIISSTGVAQVVPANGGDYVLMLDTRTRLPGDADNSTTIDARDASAILKMCVGTMELDDTCDYNGDGFVNAIDSAAILRSVVGLKK